MRGVLSSSSSPHRRHHDYNNNNDNTNTSIINEKRNEKRRENRRVDRVAPNLWVLIIIRVYMNECEYVYVCVFRVNSMLRRWRKHACEAHTWRSMKMTKCIVYKSYCVLFYISCCCCSEGLSIFCVALDSRIVGETVFRLYIIRP